MFAQFPPSKAVPFKKKKRLHYMIKHVHFLFLRVGKTDRSHKILLRTNYYFKEMIILCFPFNNSIKFKNYIVNKNVLMT